jgi:hypothetical protein
VCVCIGGYICRSPPPACQYTEGVPLPPPARSGGENRPLGSAAGPVLKFFKNINSNSLRYSNLKVTRVSIRISGIIFYVMLEQYQKIFLFGGRSNSSPSILFLKYCPFKSCEDKSFILILNFFWHSCQICGMKFKMC